MKSLSRAGLAVGAAIGLVGATLAACGGGGDQGGNSLSAGGGGSSGTHGTKSNGTSTATNTGAGGPGGGFATVGTGSNTGSGGGPQCGGTATTAQPIPLDIYIMLDKSGSMSDTTSDGTTKWADVSQALDGFFADPMSQGIDVGIQFFPLNKAGVPSSCTQQSDCPSGSGPCVLKACADGQPQLTVCTANSQCAPFQCVALGTCPQSANTYCYPVGQNISGCGVCQALTSSFCEQADSCSANQYGTPAVPIAALDSTQITNLTNAVNAHAPGGSTPTSAALGGAISYASSFATMNPTHTVVVVFATDGLPTECNPTDIPSIAQIAANGATGTPPIRTYVIGVLSQTDIMNGADTNLQSIAMSGQGQAFIINSSTDNVEQQFVAAMNQIRGAKLACEYAIPPAPDGGTQDYGKVNVEFTPPGQSMPETIGYVGSAANCDPTLGGWYYDVDPAMGGTPTKIIMCPATCSAFGNGGSIDIRVGCKTKIQPPPH
jgi:hypothetical protein